MLQVDITSSMNALTVSADVTSTTGIIDLSGVTNLRLEERPTFSAFSVTLPSGIVSSLYEVGCTPGIYNIVNNSATSGCAEQDIVANSDASNLSISANLESRSGSIDFSAYTGALTLGNNVVLKAINSDNPLGYAMDFGNVSALTFGTGNVLTVDSLGILDSDNIRLPSGLVISGMAIVSSGADITHVPYNGNYAISSVSGLRYEGIATGDIRLIDSSNSVTLSVDLTSTGGKIDFSSYNDALTLGSTSGGVTLTADNYGQSEGYSVDLSGVSMLTLIGSNDINVDRFGAIDSNTKIRMPSGFDIRDGGNGEIDYDVGDSDVEYAIKDGNHMIVANVRYPASATGDITSSMSSLTISADITSTTGIIDLSGVTTLQFTDRPTLSASVIILPENVANECGSDCVLQYCIDGDYNIVDLTAIPTSLCYGGDIQLGSPQANTINISGSEIISEEGSISLGGLYNSVTLENVTLRADDCGGSIFNTDLCINAIDLRGAKRLSFVGENNVLDAGYKDVELPSGFRIFGDSPDFAGIGRINYMTERGDFMITESDINFPATVEDDITIGNIAGNALTITADVSSESGMVDFSNFDGQLTLNATLAADGVVGIADLLRHGKEVVIDISNLTSLVCEEHGVIDAGYGKIELPPREVISGECEYIQGDSTISDAADGVGDAVEDLGNRLSDSTNTVSNTVKTIGWIFGGVTGAFLVVCTGGLLYKKIPFAALVKSVLGSADEVIDTAAGGGVADLATDVTASGDIELPHLLPIDGA